VAEVPTNCLSYQRASELLAEYVNYAENTLIAKILTNFLSNSLTNFVTEGISKQLNKKLSNVIIKNSHVLTR
jgi:hypothetical protein